MKRINLVKKMIKEAILKESKTKLVVVDNHTLGYIQPEQPNKVQILHTSILKGSPYSDRSTIYVKGHDIRLASKKDFNDFRVDGTSYFKNPNEYEFQQ